MRLTLVLLVVVFSPIAPRAEGCLEVVFDEPVLAGTSSTARIAVDSNCIPPPPPCVAGVGGDGSTDWGDGQNSSWWQQTPKPEMDAESFPIPAAHKYAQPGRYTAITRYRRYYVADEDSCDNTGVTLWDTTVVDVLPNPELLVDGWLGTFFDVGASHCSGSVSVGTELYVVAGLEGLSASGIGGAEFRLRLSASGAFLFGVQSMPGWTSVGDAFGNGVALASSCEATNGKSQAVLLKLVVLEALTLSNVNLFVEKSHVPTNPNFQDAKIIICDAPSYTAVDAGRGNVALLNPSPSGSSCAGAPTPIEKTTWSGVKHLYRD